MKIKELTLNQGIKLMNELNKGGYDCFFSGEKGEIAFIVEHVCMQKE